MKHREVHPKLDVEGCFGCRVAHVGFSAAAMPSRKGQANSIDATERRWSKDMDAANRHASNAYKHPCLSTSDAP